MLKQKFYLESQTYIPPTLLPFFTSASKEMFLYYTKTLLKEKDFKTLQEFKLMKPDQVVEEIWSKKPNDVNS